MDILDHPRILKDERVEKAVNALRNTLYETQDAVMTNHTCRVIVEALRKNGLGAWEPCFDDELEEVKTALQDMSPKHTFFRVRSGDEDVVIRCVSAPKLIELLEWLRGDRMREAGEAYAQTASSPGSAAKN